jgi:serine/threonine-protein kinase
MLRPGMFISDRYEIIDKVGSGGMADVYKARCHRLNRFVAIKVLKPEYSDDKNFVKKFRGEAQSAAGLSHPNIVSVYDVGDDNGLHYIVMELVEGITLKNFIERKGKLDIKEAVGIGIQIAMGMEAAHLNHIIHRDIKPQNIIISREGKVKVTDFGIAKATNSNTITSNAMGSVHYLSPEQARGGYSDEKSDIYSLGVTLYEMLSGQVPFAGDNTVSVALLHIQGEATPLRELDPNIPLSIEKIVQKCMQKKPERRYLTASELISDLKRSISNPNGDFVVIPPAAVSDSPTIMISDDEVNHIKNATKSTADFDTTADLFQNTDGRRAKAEVVEENTEEEDDLDRVDPRVEKIVFIGSIAAGVVLVILIIFIVVNILNLFPSGDKNNNDPEPTITVTPSPSPTPEVEEVETIIVPSVVGLSLEDAKKELYDLSESLNIVPKDAPSNDFNEGIVFEQSLKQGTEVNSDARIELSVSTGAESFEIPNVYNLTDGQAVTKLEEKGLVIEHEFEDNDEIEEGRVIKTSPERGKQVVKGDTVVVFVSNGSQTINVPDLLGSTKSEAESKLNAVGLKLGNVTEDYSETYQKDKVMKQGQPSGTAVKKDTTVDIVISRGSGVIEQPEYTSYSGRVDINENPFDYSGDSGIIKFVLDQKGTSTIIEKTELTYDDFPYGVDIVTDSKANATLHMYVGRYADAGEDGAVSENGVYVVYEQYPTSWKVHLNPVTN